MSRYKKLVKDVGVLGIVLSITRFKGVILLALLTKSLGAESYGIWTQILVTLSLVTPVILLGLPYAVVRFIPSAKTREETQEYVWSMLAITTCVAGLAALLVLLFPGAISTMLQAPANLIPLLALLIILESANALILNVFLALAKMGVYSFFNFALATGEIAFVAVSLALGYGLFGAVCALVAIRGLIVLVSLFLLLRSLGLKMPDFSGVKEYLRFGLPTIVSNASHWMVQVSDRYVITWFLGVLYVGYYAPAYTVALIINLFILPVTIVLQPVLAKLFAQDRIEEVQMHISYSLKYILAVTIPASVGLVILSRQILTIFSTEDIAIHAAPIVPFVAGSILLYSAYAIFSQILFLFKKTGTEGTIWMLAAALGIILDFLLIPSFGIMGAAIATISAYILALGLTVYYASRYLSFFIDWVFVAKSIAASLFMAAAVVLLRAEGLWSTLAATLFGAGVYGVALLLLKGFTRQELDFFIGFLRKSKESSQQI